MFRQHSIHHLRGGVSQARRRKSNVKPSSQCSARRCVALRYVAVTFGCDALRMLVHNDCVSMREMRRSYNYI